MSWRALAFVLFLPVTAWAQPQAPSPGEAAPPAPASAAAAAPAASQTGVTEASAPQAAPTKFEAVPAGSSSSGHVLGLAEALETARKYQPLMHQALAATDVSRSRVDQAAAPLYPQVAAVAAYQRKTANIAPGQFSSQAVPAPSFKTIDFFNFGLNANQMIYDFGQTWKRKSAAKVTVEARKSDEQATALQIEQNVRVAFFTARADKAMISVARETLENQERHLHQIEGFVRAGTRAEIDLAQVRTDYANAQVNVITAENSYASDKATLNQAMGVERDTDYEVSDDGLPAVEGEDGALDPLVKEALDRRPEFVSLQKQLQAQQLTVESIQGAYWPTLGVSTAVSEAGRHLDNMAWNWNAGATINWPIFQGGITNAQVDEARATAKGLLAQVEILQQQVRVDVEQARLGVRATKSVL
ncbi:MAG: TolC family protein, partial [Polyangiales bacterium]